MKKYYKILGITFLMFLLTTFTVNAHRFNSFTTEIETPLVIEDWMMDESYWNDIDQDTIKSEISKSMLAITPNGDTVTVYISDIIESKDSTTVSEYNTYNTYNSYNNYDYYKDWSFYYNNSWLMGNLWYTNYYHVYYPIAYHKHYYNSARVIDYYKRHNVTFIENHRRIPSVYTRPTNKRDVYRSRYNTNNERIRNYTTPISNKREQPKSNVRTTQPNNHNVYRSPQQPNRTIRSTLPTRSSESHSGRR